MFQKEIAYQFSAQVIDTLVYNYWPRAIEQAELFPAPREKCSGLLIAQALNNYFITLFHFFVFSVHNCIYTIMHSDHCKSMPK